MKIADRTKIDARIAGAFRVASETTGATFDQLARTAARESDLRTDLASSSSSAKGLYQFVDQTWYELIKKEGPSVGLERLAAQITSDGKGGWTVADAREKAKILSLKTDPLVSSVMAGRFTEANTRSLTESLGRAPSDGEVYAAHVLGAGGAAKLVRLAEREAGTTASLAFPKAAAANPDLFYGAGGKPRTAAELLARLTGTTSDTTARIAAAHAAAATATTATPKLDPKALAGLVRAQAAAAVAGQGLATDGLDRLVSERFTRTALAEKGLPGASRDVVPAAGARIAGWRAKAASDAFSALMRSDAATETGEASTTGQPGSAPPIRFAAVDTRHAVGGVAGGIPYVDPNQPLRLGVDTTSLAAATSGGSAAATSGGSAAAMRPSRLMSAAARGAPAMPLPMVDGATVVRPMRITITPATLAATPPATSGLVAEGAARVKTVSIAPAASAKVAASRPLLPPVPGETADPAAPTVPAVSTASVHRAARNLRPLDLLDLSRRALAGN
jgi:hypothetical protein